MHLLHDIVLRSSTVYTCSKPQSILNDQIVGWLTVNHITGFQSLHIVQTTVDIEWSHSRRVDYVDAFTTNIILKAAKVLLFFKTVF